jgi:hypothetical protein
MHVMLARRLRRTTYLTFESIAGPDALTDLRPVRAIVVRVVGPGSSLAQMRESFLGERKPVASRLQFARRQVEGFFSKIFLRIPAALAKACVVTCNSPQALSQPVLRLRSASFSTMTVVPRNGSVK